MHQVALRAARKGFEKCSSQWVVYDMKSCNYSHRASFGHALSYWEKGGAIGNAGVPRRPGRDPDYGACFLWDILMG